MALIEQRLNRTIDQRYERQGKRELLLTGVLDDVALNRQQRRALRTATLSKQPSKRDIIKSYKKKPGGEEHLRRLVAFYGSERIFGRDYSYYLSFGKGSGSAWPVQPLNRDESRRLKKIRRKAKR